MLLGILLFNWFGYRLVVSYMQDKFSKELEARLDNNNYDESQLISVKIPVSLSYYNSSQLFERIDGSVKINGIQYKFVKRRIYNDSLELMCLPDQEAMKLESLNNDIFRLVNGIQANPEKRQGAHSLPNKAPIVDPYVFMDPFPLHFHVFKLLSVAYYQPEFISSVSPATDERPPAMTV